MASNRIRLVPENTPKLQPGDFSLTTGAGSTKTIAVWIFIKTATNILIRDAFWIITGTLKR